VRKPRHKLRHRRGYRLVKVVRSQSPAPGAQEPAGTKVNVTLRFKRVRIRHRRR
jgi:hypothetical protein